ncbi:protein CNPPD1-like [Ptychodera flava]|uniref:protein CNPPD1-like n=1 Tax=Ptychodera flava TaxID=63121 RepID=UPI00396A5840
MEFSPSFDILGFPGGDIGNYEDSPGHEEFTERLRKTLYYGADPNTDQPSLPVTDVAVEFFQNASPLPCKKIDKKFATKVSRKSSVSPCAFMLSMMYIERMKYTNPDYLKKMSSADLFLVSMMLASKYLYDEGEEEELYNDEWADIAGVEVDDVNQMEMDFLAAMDWNLYVKPIDFFLFLHCIERRIAFQEGNKRGWFSYTDLSVLIDGEDIYDVCIGAVTQTLQVAGVCTLMYGMCAAALIGSSVLASQSAFNATPHTAIDLPELPLQPILESICLAMIHYPGTQEAALNNCHVMLNPRFVTNSSAFTAYDMMISFHLDELWNTVLHLQYSMITQLINAIICLSHAVISLIAVCVQCMQHYGLFINNTDVMLGLFHTETDVLHQPYHATTNLTDVNKQNQSLPTKDNAFNTKTELNLPTVKPSSFSDATHSFVTNHLIKVF